MYEPRYFNRPYALPSTFAILAGSAIHNEVKELGKTFVRRGRKRFADYVLGAPSYYNTRNRKNIDKSLMRLTSVRRSRTTRRMAKRGRARSRRRSSYRPYRRRARARRAMGTNGPAFRTRFKRSRYNADLGMPMGYLPSRRTIAGASKSNALDKVLHTVRLVNIEYSDADSVMNMRTGRLVDVVGVKFRAWFSLKDNLIETSNIWQNPIQVRWAIINPRENTGEESDVTAGTNFFLSDDPAGDDATDFPAAANCFRYMNRKINRRKYGVLQEGTFLIQNDPAASNTRVNAGSKKFVSFYLPIKRQMKWANNTTGVLGAYPNANLHFVYWFVSMGDKDTVQKFSDSPFDFTHENITYFKNPEILNG